MQDDSDRQHVLPYLVQVAQMLATADEAPAGLLAETLAAMAQKITQDTDSRVTLANPLGLATVLDRYHAMDILRVRFQAETFQSSLAAVSNMLRSLSPELDLVTMQLQAQRPCVPHESADRYISLDDGVAVVLIDLHQRIVRVIHRTREGVDLPTMSLTYTGPDREVISIPLREEIY